MGVPYFERVLLRDERHSLSLLLVPTLAIFLYTLLDIFPYQPLLLCRHLGHVQHLHRSLEALPRLVHLAQRLETPPLPLEQLVLEVLGVAVEQRPLQVVQTLVVVGLVEEDDGSVPEAEGGLAPDTVLYRGQEERVVVITAGSI